MRQHARHFPALVLAQAACLALGLWLDHRLITASGLRPSQPAQRISESAGGTAANASPPAAISAANSMITQNRSAVGIHTMTFLWIAALQTVVAYLFLTRRQEEITRQQTETEKVSLQRYNDLLRTRDAVIFGLAGLADSRDPETGKHLERIAAYSTCLASALARNPLYQDQITPSFVKLIGISSALHDIGKVGIRDALLLKPGKFEEHERTLMQLHATIGGGCVREIESRLGDSNFLQMARDIALYHHERWDGRGYPKQLAGRKIPLAARIVSVADVYDALATKRVYKGAFPHEHCVEIIRNEAGKAFEPAIVGTFMELESEFRDICRRFQDASERNSGDDAHFAESAEGAVTVGAADDDELAAVLELLGQYRGELSTAIHNSALDAPEGAIPSFVASIPPP